MASSSDDPQNEKLQNPVSRAIQSNNDSQDAKVEPVKEISPPSVFVNSEPIREEQVQNAVKFLSHPKVRGSPIIYRRSFLERKGLTKEEIDEAFKRVPDSSPVVTTTQTVVNNQDGQTKSSLQQQPPAQVLQPASVGTVGGSSKKGILSSFHWYHGVLAVSFLAVSGAGTALLIKKTVVPRLKSWIRGVLVEEDEVSLMKKDNVKPSVAEEAAAAAKSAAAAAADVARASQEILETKSEEKRCFEELVYMLNLQVHEMKSMSGAIQKLEGQNINGRLSVHEQSQRISGISSRQPYTNRNVDTDSRSVRSLSPPASVEPSAAPHIKSYMEPWDVYQAKNVPVNAYPTQVRSNGTIYDYLDNRLNGDEMEPSWQQKNARITEIESGDEQKLGSSNMWGNERPIQRSWVPPQSPPVAMREAATAIRQPKKALYQTDQLTDDQLLARSANMTNALRKVTQKSNSGGLLDATGENPTISSNEISMA